MIGIFDCHGDFPTLGAFLFSIMIDDEHYSYVGVNVGLEEIQLLVAGRYRAMKIEVLFKYV